MRVVMQQGCAAIRSGLILFILAAPLFPAPECGRCHPKEFAAYTKSAMGNSLTPPTQIEGASIVHKPSGARILITEHDGAMIHSLTTGGIEATFPVVYQIGAGKIGHTYVVRTGDYLFESPASWYRQHGWDVSPGYQRMTSVAFDRLVESACMFCHADNPVFSGSDGHRLSGPLTAISCARCHGSGEEHARRPSAKNIINPAKLTRRARDSICEQCHLEGENRLLNPGKTWRDFHAGDEFENVAATYFLSGSDHNVRAVGQVEQLAMSKCVRASGGKLWCGTCHNPHGPQGANRAGEIREVCSTCHSTLSKANHAAANECTSCHMPRLTPDDIPHAASTDHRILRRPAALGGGGTIEISAWQEPPAAFRDRDLAVAALVIGGTHGLSAIREQGVKLLEALPKEVQDNDPAVLSSLVSIRLQRRELPQAAILARRAVALQPDSGFASLNLANVLENAGDDGAAESQYLQTIDLDSSLDAAWTNLVFLYGREGRKSDRAALIDRYLKWNPQSIWFRQLKAMSP